MSLEQIRFRSICTLVLIGVSHTFAADEPMAVVQDVHESLGEEHPGEAIEAALEGPHFGHPSWSWEKNLVAVDCGRGGELDLCLYDVQRDRIRRLTWTDEQELVPAFSPDGSRLSFTRQRGELWVLAVLDLEGGEVDELVELTIPYATASSWSPTEGRIAFDMKNADGDHDIYSIRPDGSGLRVLIGGPGDQRFATYSPDGSSLAYSHAGEGAGDIMIADANGTNARAVVSNAADEGVPAWSPDGRHLSYYSRHSGNFEIFVVDLEDGSERQLTRNAAFDIFAPFSPDGRSVIFESTRDRDPESFDEGADLYRFDLETGKVERLTEPADFPLKPAASAASSAPLQGAVAERQLTDWPGSENGAEFSPDGAWIAFDAIVDGQADLYLLHLDSGVIRQLTDTSEADRQPTWSPDGTRIAFESVRDGVRGIWSMPVAGGEPTRIFVEPGLRAFSPDYSPHGDLVFTVLEPDSSRTYGRARPWVLPASGKARPVTEGFDHWRATWGPEGAWLYYHRGSTDHFEAVHVTSGASRKVSRGRYRGWQPALAPDGRHLAFVSNPFGSLWLAARGEDISPVQLTHGSGGDEFSHFAPDGRSIVFSSDRARNHIVELDLATRRRREVAEGILPHALPAGGIAFLSTEGEDTTVAIADREGKVRRLDLALQGIGDYAFHPDGSSIVVSARGAGPVITSDLYLAALHRNDLDATNLQRLTHELEDKAGAETPVWCSQHLLGFSSNLEGLPFRQIAFLDLETGFTRQVTDSPSSKFLVDCAEEGHRITFRRVAGQAGLVTARRAGPEKAFDERVERDSGQGSLSPDGQSLAYITRVEGRTDLFLRQANGEVVRLTDDDAVESEVRWRPDGTGLVFSVRTPNRNLWLLTLPDLS